MGLIPTTTFNKKNVWNNKLIFIIKEPIMGMFGFIYDFFKNWGILLTTIMMFLVFTSTCGIKGRIHYLNTRIDTLQESVTRLETKNGDLQNQLIKTKQDEYIVFDSMLDRKHYKLLKYEKQLDERELHLGQVKRIMIDRTN